MLVIEARVALSSPRFPGDRSRVRQQDDYVIGIEMVGGTDWIGGQIYVRNLIASLSRLPAGERPEIVLTGYVTDDNISRELLTFEGVRLGPQGFSSDRALWHNRLRNKTRRLRRLLTGSDPWYQHIDVVYPIMGPPGPAGSIFWIPDFQHMYLPDFFTREERVVRSSCYEAISEENAVVVLSSQMAAQDFKRLFPAARAEPMLLRFCSVMDPLPPLQDPRPRYGLPAQFIYVPNQFWLHKNHEQVLRALGILRCRGVRIPLVCTGHMEDYRSPGHVERINHLVRANSLDDAVHFLGLLPRQEQIQLFRYAAVVVQPSRFEGWSTVIEDARALGRPTILADFPVHREQMPDSHFFPLDDDEALADALQTFWRDARPGPDLYAEECARIDALRRQRRCARDFLKIVQRSRELSQI